MKRFLGLAFLGLMMNLAGLQATPKKVIFDTDMGNDVDDALAQVMLYDYRDRDEMELLAMVINKATPRALIATDLIARFYGHAEVPLGLVDLKRGKSKGDGWFLKELLAHERATGIRSFDSTYAEGQPMPDAVRLMRQVLAQQEDHSVHYISVGFLSNLAHLLQSGPDEFSPLNGKDLMAKKVKQVSLMAAAFTPKDLANPAQAKREFNVYSDVEASRYAFENCPVPMIFSGHEIGRSIRYPREAVDQNFAEPKPHPVHVAYVAASRNHHKNNGRHDWATYDLTSVLYVMEPDLFQLSEPGTASVIDSQGRVKFERNPAGRHRYLKLRGDADRAAILKRLLETTSVKPRKP